MTLRELEAARQAVLNLIEEGLLALKPKLVKSVVPEKQTQRLCMARLRAERRGEDVSRFPKRQRNRKKSLR